MKTFENSKWIWLAQGEMADSYADFYDSFEYSSNDRVIMNVSADSDYTLYVNGVYTASNQYGGYEHYKIYDVLDITDKLKAGKNDIKITVHYFGVASQRYCPAPAGLIYEVKSTERVLAFSSENTLSRLDPAYISGKKVVVSGQLGFTFFYDATAEREGGYERSVQVNKNCTFYPRPIKKATVYPEKPMKSVTKYDDTHFLIDLGGEVVGLPTLRINSSEAQTLTVAFGEHIDDGCVRKNIGGRNFYYQYTARAGENSFTNYMLRLGCRYLEVFAQKPIELHYVGVLPQVYDVKEKTCAIEGELERRIYDICVNTLKLCMMEHYVDCPWREQALYAFDSRNQMLCGYYAFEDMNAEYARANLKLIGQDRRKDGLLSICYPSGSSLAIPSFSLYYLLEMREYLEYTGDTTLAEELFDKLCGICDEFLSNTENGLVKKFAGEQMWNFYDWSQYSEGTLGRAETPEPDLAVNCLTVIALEQLEVICQKLERDFPYKDLTSALRKRIRETFLDANGLFSMHERKAQYTVLGNSLAILAQVPTDDEAQALCERLTDGSLVDCSLSMKVLEYDALLQTDKEKYSKFVLDEIRTNYKRMLDAGSDTVWETIKGGWDFGNAGSLCHGWSAVPVYIFHKLGIAR